MSKLRNKQLELLRTAVQLAEDNPGLEIEICARSDELCSEFAWTSQQITRVEVEWQYRGEEWIFVGLGDIQDHLECLRDEEVTEEQAKEVSEQAILIYTGA